jgi:chromosome partitioning protein
MLDAEDRTMRTIALLNWKGGTGKTTTALALSVGLARRIPKERVLLVDADPAANAGLVMLAGLHPERPTLTDVLMDEADAVEAIRTTRISNLDILPSDSRLAECTAWLADELGRERRLRVALRSVEEHYSICVVDSPPQFSLISLNVLAGVEQVIVPIDPGVFSIHGLARLQETIDQIRRHLEHLDLAIIGLLMTKTMNNRHTRALREQLEEVYGKLLYKASIPWSITVEECHAAYLSIMEGSPRSAVAKAYDQFVTEVLKHHGQSKNRSSGKRRPRHDAA